MKKHYSVRILTAAALVLVTAAAGVFSLLRQNIQEPSPEKVVNQAWSSLARVGEYQFSTTITQTTYLAPSVQNVGHTSQKEIYFISGSTNLNEETMQISLWQNEGSLLEQKDGVEIRIDQETAQGRAVGEEWQSIDRNVVDGFAPGNDALSFLVAARNVRPAGSELISADRVTRYDFDVDSNQFAMYMRDQLTRELARSGELPLGLQLDVSDEYRRMAADGSLWVSAEGYPLRLQMEMLMPEQKNGQRVEALIQTDFVQPAARQLRAGVSPTMRLAGWIGLPGSARQVRDGLAQASVCAALAAFILLCTLFSSRRISYPVIAGLVIVTMLVSPVWNGAKTSAFSQHNTEKLAEQQAAQQARENAEAQARELVTSTWDPHSLPLNQGSAVPAAPRLWSGPSSLDGLFQAGQEAEEESSDADQDGLTDAYEADFAADVLDPNSVDTDSDGLTDGQEVKLALLPGQVDSDHDGIHDGVEVGAFDYADLTWYINPGSNDTDKDGNADGQECPQRASFAGAPASGVCQDTDADGTPDVFDTDDDNDGVPTYVDESAYTMNRAVYQKDAPFQLALSNLTEGAPVFITYQLQPTNLKHLTYTMNVLDWPSGDDDGQIQRISDTTFANSLTPGELEKDPRAANGDLRLTPMVEIRFPAGSDLPLPLTSTMHFAVSSPGYSAAFSLTGESVDGQSRTTIRVEDGPAGEYQVALGRGTCAASTGVIELGSMGELSTRQVNAALSEFADGAFSFFIRDLGGVELACVTVPSTPHGSLTDQVIDTTSLRAYGAFALNGGDGSVLIYSPLSLVYDYEGSTPAAFSMKVPYVNRDGAFDDSVQELRLVWAINMLTDICKPLPADHDEAADGTWCDKNKPERWTKDVPRLIQTYSDEFYVTGISITEENGVDMLAIYEDPTTDSDQGLDDALWALSHGLQSTFLAGRAASGGETRDLTIAEIENRFSQARNSSLTSSDPRLWGLPKDAFRVHSYHYSSTDGFVDFSSRQASSILNGGFAPPEGGSYPDAVTMLFAREQNQRLASLDESQGGCAASMCSIDFSEEPMITQAVLNWAPYQHKESGWEAAASQEYLDLLEAQLRGLPEFTPADGSDDARAEVDGQIFIARFYYESLLNGIAQLVALNGVPTVNILAVLDDWQIRDQFYELNAKAQLITKVAKTLTESLVNGLAESPALRAAYASSSKSTSAGAFFRAIGKGLAQKVTNITKLFSNLFLKIVGGIIAIAAVVAITASLVLYLLDSDSAAGRIGGRILFGSLGLLTTALAVGTAVQAINAWNTTKKVAEASSKAALVGMIIGVVITWGVFIAQWVTSGAMIFSLAFNNMLADAIAATCTIVLMAALACTGVGAIVVAVIAAIDALISTICAVSGVNEEDGDKWVRDNICIGISGWVTKLFKWVIYSMTYLIDYDNDERLTFSGLDHTLRDISAGMTYGNAVSVSLGVTNTITKASIPIDWKAAVYFWQFSDSNAKSAAFNYSITGSEDDIHSGLNRGDTTGWTSTGEDDSWSKKFQAETNGYSIALPAAGINRDPATYLNEGSAVPVQECWVIPTPWGPIPICYIRTERNTIHIPVSATMTVDVLPATLDEFYGLAPSGSGYTLDWGRDAGLTFGTLRDADGDGLLSKAHADGNDPDDSAFDTDGDFLSDRYEIANGLNPSVFDTDDDGLRDKEELDRDTDPLRKDTDGDGLPDAEEIAGWLFTYGFESDGTPLETMVYPDPKGPDGDQDGLTDLMEKIYGFNPNSADAASVLDYSLTIEELDSPLILLGLDEAGGATAFTDSSNYGFGAVCEGSSCPVSGFPGRVGSAIHAYSSDPLRLPTSARTITLAENQPFTLSAWVRSEGGGVILAKWNEDAASSKEVIFSLAGGYLSLTSGSGASVTSAASAPTGVWTHVAATFDGTNAAFYINGVSTGCAGSCAWSNTPSFASGYVPAQITVGGAENAPVDTFQGYLDEIGLFNRALSSGEVADRLMPANYNFNDTYVRPGEEVTYHSRVSNLLQSRFAYGMFTTEIDPQEAVVNAGSLLAPETFVLYPDNPVVTGVNTADAAETMQIDPAYPHSGSLRITQTVEASVVDRRTESNMAELWLKFDEGAVTTQYEDSSGNMPLRSVVCGSNCAAYRADGILNRAVTFAGGGAPLGLPSLSRMNLVNHGFTISLWVNPQGSAVPGSALTLLDTPNHRLSVSLQRASDSAYTPQVTLNGSAVSLTSLGSRQVQAGTWANLVVQYTGTTNELKVYLNGTAIGVRSGAGAILADDTLSLGSSSPAASYSVDDLRIFSRPLGSLDINRLAERPVLVLSMDSSSFADSSVYHQGVSVPKQWPVTNTNSVRGTSLNARSGSETGFIRVQGNSMLNLSDGAFTISTWVYPTANESSTWQGIWGYRSNIEYDGGAVDVNAYPTLERLGTQLRFLFGSGSTYEMLSPISVLSENQWNHVTVTFQPDGSGRYEMKLYVNAVVRASKIFDHAPGANTSQNGFFVGTSSGVTRLKVYHLHMDDEHDAGSHAEVYIEEYLNGGYYRTTFDEGDIGDGDDPWVGSTLTMGGYENVEVQVWEEDDSSGDDYCGSIYRSWYNDRDTGTRAAGMSDGFSGSLDYQFFRASLPFTGLIDEMEMYRYPLDSEQVYDLYSSVMLTADLPLDDRPATASFENSAQVENIYNGVCAQPQCPTAGTSGLINQAARYDGVDDRITVPVQTTSDVMLSLWLNTGCQNCGLYQLTSSGSTLNQVYLRSGNLCVKTGSTETCTRGGTLADEQWHHAAYSNNGHTAVLWLDGQPVNSLNVTSTIAAAPSGSAVLGYAPDAGQPYYRGQLDDVRIYRVSQGESYLAGLIYRAPLFLAHLDESSPADGMQDATLTDWTLSCGQTGDACPQGNMEGRLKKALEFDGLDDAVVLDQNPLSGGAAEFTVGLWVMPTSLVDHPQTLWALTEAHSSQVKYGVSIAADSMRLCVQSAANPACSASSAVELIQNVWNYVTLTVTRASSTQENYSLYINGYLDSTGSGSTGAQVSSGLGGLTLGNTPQSAAGFGGGAYHGRLDEPVIYGYAQNEIDVRSTFHYQMASVEETSTLELTIDADAPQVELVSYDAAFPYLNGTDRILQVNASDATSGVARVEMQVNHGPDDTYQPAPACADSGENAAFCPTFITGEDDGRFDLSFRAVDRVGASASAGPYPFYIDNGGPRVLIHQLDGQLTPAGLHPSQENTWIVSLSGAVQDEVLGDGSTGSGIDPSSVQVTLYSQAREITGAGTQKPELVPSGSGYSWALDYRFPEHEPSGELTVLVEAKDRVGNLTQKEIRILLDASPSRSSLDPVGLPQLSAGAIGVQNAQDPTIYTGGTLTGSASDLPGSAAPYITSDGYRASSNVSQVQVAFTPSLNISYLYGEPYPGGVLAWLPLDNADLPVGEDGALDPSAPERYFVDISPHQLEGVCAGSGCPQPGIQGHTAGSMYFDGRNRSINLGQAVNLANRSFTISTWANLEETGRNNPILWQGPASIPQQRILFGFNAENRFVCGFGGSDLVTEQAYLGGEWHAWACTFDQASGARRIFVDGQVAAADTAMPVPEMNENLFVGAAPSGSLSGFLDELMVLGEGLDPEAVRRLYTGFGPVFLLGIDDKFVIGGDSLVEQSGFYGRALLTTGSGDINNKVGAGQVGDYSLNLDGNDSVSVQPGYQLALDRGAFSLAGWVNPQPSGAERDIISQRGENPERRYPSLTLTPDGKVKVGFGSGYAWLGVETAPGLVPDGAWTHVMAAFDGEALNIYINGALAQSFDSLRGEIPYAALQFNVGEGFTGLLDDVRVYPRALDALEARALAAGGWITAEQSAVENEVTWSVSAPAGLEGPYRIDTRAWDSQGHYDTGGEVINQWSGVIDTLAPRMVVTREIDPDDETSAAYTFVIEDTMLDEESIRMNICDEVSLEREYYNSAWYLANGVAVNSAAYRITGSCTGSRRTTEITGVWACDQGGNCNTKTFSPFYTNTVYLPAMFSSGGSMPAGLPDSGVSEEIRAAAESWPFMSIAATGDPQGSGPEIGLIDDRIEQSSRRNPVMLNLQGWAFDPDGIERVEAAVYQNGVEVYSTQAAVFGELWNAMWFHPAGSPPEDGQYQLVITAVDRAGVQSTLTREITIDLRP